MGFVYVICLRGLNFHPPTKRSAWNLGWVFGCHISWPLKIPKSNEGMWPWNLWLAGAFKYFVCSPRSMGKWSNLTNAHIFQMGWGKPPMTRWPWMLRIFPCREASFLLISRPFQAQLGWKLLQAEDTSEKMDGFSGDFHRISRWWFQYFLFSPLFGEDFQFD